MPVQQTVTVRYWTWCGGWFKYPCRKTKQETQWCYEFGLSRSRCWGFWEQHQACENGIEYHYSSGCFGYFGWAIRTTPYVKCFKNQLKSKGQCSISGDFPGGGVPAPGPVID